MRNAGVQLIRPSLYWLYKTTNAAGWFLALAGCALPRWPVAGPVTSAFGLRLNGVMPEIHRGVDLAVPVGTPVQAMRGGTVEYAGSMGGYGNVIVLRHSLGTRSLYAHLSALRVSTGEHVAAHQVIGLSGMSGNASGPHLHFEVTRWGQLEDPVPLLGGPPLNPRR